MIQMKREYIIDLATKAGIYRFAAMPTKNGPSDVWDILRTSNLIKFAQLLVEAEREACAKICKDFHKASEYPGFVDCADAIRARE